MPIKVGPSLLEDWDKTITGDGVINISGGIATLTSGEGTGRAYFSRAIDAKPGELYTVRVLARRLTGADGTSARVGIDYPAAASLKNYVEINSPRWQWYECSLAVPVAVSDDSYINPAIGIYDTLGGSIGIAEIQVLVDNAGYSTARIFAGALIRMNAGTPEINSSFQRVGIKSASYDAGTKRLTLTCDSIGFSDKAAPLFNACLSVEAGGYKYVPRVGLYNRTTGTVVVEFHDMSLASPEPADISALTNLYVWITAIV